LGSSRSSRRPLSLQGQIRRNEAYRCRGDLQKCLFPKARGCGKAVRLRHKVAASPILSHIRATSSRIELESSGTGLLETKGYSPRRRACRRSPAVAHISGTTPMPIDSLLAVKFTQGLFLTSLQRLRAEPMRRISEIKGTFSGRIRLRPRSCPLKIAGGARTSCRRSAGAYR